MKTAREILEELVKRIGYDIHKQQETAENENKLIDAALLALREVVVPEKLDSGMVDIGVGEISNSYEDGWNACRSELLHRLNGNNPIQTREG